MPVLCGQPTVVGDLTTKMVALADALGRLSRFVPLAGHRHESPAAGLLSGLSFGTLLADQGFDSDRLRSLLAYARRHRVENFYCKINNFCRIATRYDQTESSYAATICMAAASLALA